MSIPVISARLLLEQRRWMLWIPFMAAGLAAPTLSELPATAAGVAIFGTPFWLAWWLSDGFAGLFDGRGEGDAVPESAMNCAVPVSSSFRIDSGTGCVTTVLYDSVGREVSPHECL